MGETKTGIGSYLDLLTPNGLKRVVKSSKTWLIAIASLVVFWLTGGFTDGSEARLAAAKCVLELLKYAVPLALLSTGIEDCGAKIFGKSTEIISANRTKEEVK